MASKVQRVSFEAGGAEIAGNLHLPGGFDESRPGPMVVIATPGSSVKEQIGAFYADRLAAGGIAALAFDPSHQGESAGMPRDLEDPAARVEDIRSAVDFLATQPFVGDSRVGMLGICAGGGYAVKAALMDKRLGAVGLVVPVNIGRAFRAIMPGAETVRTLDAAGAQRTAEARGGPARREPWIPDTLADAKAAGITDPDTLQAVEYYRESAFRHPNSTNRLHFDSMARLLTFDAFHLVPELLTQPLSIVAAGRAGNTGSLEDGKTLHALATTPKDLLVIEGAGHYDLYDKPQFVDQAVDRLVPFFRHHLERS
ncbi:alpha/beta hydrolase [Acuticoccus sediminis]|uniref:alpha/beta hydrolase n=1 Tax=Acuticoccus sediminis TaxID=2184697 RepID=UPI001CFDCAE1|nr:alpha/beta hydrolase [Acuticoccus sediminis]